MASLLAMNPENRRIQRLQKRVMGSWHALTLTGMLITFAEGWRDFHLSYPVGIQQTEIALVINQRCSHCVR